MKQRIHFVFVLLCACLCLGTAANPEGGNPNRQASPDVGQDSKPISKSKGTPLHPDWEVRYVSGSLALKPNRWLRIAFVPHETLGGVLHPIVSLPVEQVTLVEFNAKAEKASEMLMERPRSGCYYAQSLLPHPGKNPRPDVAVITPFSPGPVSRFAAKLNHTHPIRIVWRDVSWEEIFSS